MMFEANVSSQKNAGRNLLRRSAEARANSNIQFWRVLASIGKKLHIGCGRQGMAPPRERQVLVVAAGGGQINEWRRLGREPPQLRSGQERRLCSPSGK